MKEVTKIRLEKRIGAFERKGWEASVVIKNNSGSKLYVTDPRGWRRDEDYTNPKKYSEYPERRDAIRFANLCKIHYRKYPGLWMECD